MFESREFSLSLRGVLFADLFKLLVPDGPAIVSLLFEPSDYISVLIKVNHNVSSLWREEGEKKKPTELKMK